MSCGVDVSLIEASNMASTRAAGLKDGAYPIWDWLARHHPLDQRALQSLLVDDGAADKASAIFSILKQKRLHSSSIDSFISFLKTGFRGGSLCISPNCMGCYHSGQDVLLFVHKLSEFLRNAPHIGDSKLVADLVSFSRECRSLLYTSSTKLEEYYRQEWRFLSFEERKGYYRVFSRMCKPLLISLSRLFFTLFRGFLKARSHDSPGFKSCMEELLMIKQSYSTLSASTLYEFKLIEGVELGLPEQSGKTNAISVMYKLYSEDIKVSDAKSAFEKVRMPDEIIESPHLVLGEIGRDRTDFDSLASQARDPVHNSVLRGLGFRRDLLEFLAAICNEDDDKNDDKTFESITHISSIPLAFRDELSLLNLDDARSLRGDSSLPNTAAYIDQEARQSDTVLHVKILSICTQKLRKCAGQAFSLDADLLDFAKAIRSLVSLVSDTSSSTFLKLSFLATAQHDHSVFRCCVALAQLCVNAAASNVASGTNHAAAAFVLMSVAVSIAKRQKQGPGNEPQISKNREESFAALNHLSNIDEFHSALSAVDANSCCRFVSSWLLAGEGQFFKLFLRHREIMSVLVPLDESRMLCECISFIRLESFQHYIPASCYTCLTSQPAFATQFVAIFSSRQGLETSRIPQCISPFSSPLSSSQQSVNFGGHIVDALFSTAEVNFMEQKAAASIVANVICSDPEANHMSLIGSILQRIKSGENANGSRIAIETLLPVMEHAGLHATQMNPNGGIQGGWYNEGGFFMRLLLGKTIHSTERTDFLHNLSVTDLLASLEQPSSCLDPKQKAFHINLIFANFILLSRGIAKSLSMWRLESLDQEGMRSRMLGLGHQDRLPDLIRRVFVVLKGIHENVGQTGLFLFSLQEMISVAASLLSARNFANRRPLNEKETQDFMFGLLPLLILVPSDDVEAVSSSICSVISPEVYVACMDNSRNFDAFWQTSKNQSTMKATTVRSIAQNFVSNLSALRQLSQTHVAVATCVIRLYFNSLVSMFSFNITNDLTYWVLTLKYGQEKTHPRKSVFVIESWPKLNAHSVNFELEDVTSALDALSTKEIFECFWTSAMGLQDILRPGASISQQLSVLTPCHQAIAHAVTFTAVRVLENSMKYHFFALYASQNEAYRKAQTSGAEGVREYSLRLEQLCSILLPPRIDEKKWAMALPVLRHILLQQTSFLSSSSSLFLGEPVLVDGDLFAASHSPWANGKADSLARMISSGAYDNHFLFGGDREPGSGKGFRVGEGLLTVPHTFPAVLSTITSTFLDLLGNRASFLTWLNDVVSCNHRKAFPKHMGIYQNGHPKIELSSKVRIHGLLRAPELNGREGVVSEKKDDRWTVLIAADEWRPAHKGIFKPDNLQLLLLNDFPSDFSSPLHSEVAIDILGLLPFYEKQSDPGLWSEIYSLCHLEHTIFSHFFNLDLSQRLETGITILRKDALQYISGIYNVRGLFTPNVQANFDVYSQFVTNAAGLSHFWKSKSQDVVKGFISDFDVKLRTWRGDADIPAHARCLMMGSFFRIASACIVAEQSVVDATTLISHCTGFCSWFHDWFSKVNLDDYVQFDRSGDTNCFSSAVTAGFEAVRSAIHCLTLLPFPQLELSRTLGMLSPLFTASRKDLVNIVLSTITKTKHSLQENSRVIVHHLTSEGHVAANGTIATVIGPMVESSGRWPVDIQVSDEAPKRVGLQLKNMYSERFTVYDTLQLISSVLLNAEGGTTAAFSLLLQQPGLFLTVCNWLMKHHQDAHFSQLVVRLVAAQNFPKVVDMSQPRSKMTGIINVGNTCYIASMYQQLASIPKFVSALQSAEFGPEGKRLCVSSTSKVNFLKDFLAKISNQYYCSRADDVKDYYEKLGFSLSKQQDDPLSVLRSMIDWIVAETSDYDRHKHGDETKMKQTALDSKISAAFVSKICKKTTWQEGASQNSEQMDEIESIFDFPPIDTLKGEDAQSMESLASIQDALTAHFIDKKGTRGGESNTTCQVTLEFDRLPEVLVLGLNSCGNYALCTHGLIKDNRVPSIPDELDMSKCARLSAAASQKNTCYVLNGIILHHGAGVTEGHYTSLIRCADSSWVHINDDETIKMQQCDIETIMNRRGAELPKVNGMLPVYLTGKPYAVFYVVKSASHPCAAVLSDPRLVSCLATTAQSLDSVQSSIQASLASQTGSLCFKLAPLLSHDPDRSLSIAKVCNSLLSVAECKFHVTPLQYFQQIAGLDDTELLFSMCKWRNSGMLSDTQSLDKLLCSDLALQLVSQASPCASRGIYRRLVAAFEIAASLSDDCRHGVCQSVCALLSNFRLAVGEAGILKTKAYAVLKSIADVPVTSPFLHLFSKEEVFVEAVASISLQPHALPAQEKSNLRDDDEDGSFLLVRTSTSSDVIQKLRALTAEPVDPSSS